ncbi:hypothetical protein C8J57DRAFT_1463847 [Mycena rebaudengoi]|nr:hypothetical protein C8J57DRAFT_1463847 [Mycena rebaudengoi]
MSADEGHAIVMGGAPAFLFLHIAGGHILIPILVATMLLSRKIHRHPTLVNFVGLWIPYSIGYTLLFYVNQQGSRAPSRALCVAQGIIVQGTPPASSIAGLALVLQIFFNLGGKMQQWTERGRRIFNIVALSAPYITFIVFIIFYGALQAQVPFLMGPQDTVMYCSTEGAAAKNPTLAPSLKGIVGISTLLDPLFAAIVLLVCIGFLSVIMLGIYRSFFVYKKAKKDQPLISCALRVCGFMVYSLAIVATAIVSLLGVKTAAPFLIQSSLPFVVFLLFGTQADVVRAWTDAARFVLRLPQPSATTFSQTESQTHMVKDGKLDK